MVKSGWTLTKKIFSQWSDHEAPRMGAALAFYTILSLSPLLLLAVAIAGLFFDRSGVTQQLTAQITALVGESAGQAVTSALQSAQKSAAHGIAASAFSIVLLLVSASGVFGELRTALNKIWGVKPKPAAGIWGMIRDQVFSYWMVIAVGFLLLASLIASAALAVAAKFFGGLMPMPPVVAGLIDLVISLAGVALILTLTFRYVPAAKVAWRQAWWGGGLTAVLFTVGKYLIGIYLAKAAVGSAYGAAGSIIAIIVWVYYTAQIFFFGAEFTHVIGARPQEVAPEPAPDRTRTPEFAAVRRNG